MSKKYFTSRIIKLIMVIAVCSLLVFLNPQGVFNPVRKVFFVITYPFQKVVYFLGGRVVDWRDFLKSISDLKTNNMQLTKENRELLAEIAKLKTEEAENKFLREQLKLIPREEYNLEAGFVIGQDPQRRGSWLMIDKGRRQGIKEDMPVIVSRGILIGKIDEVYETSAKVSLLTDSLSSVNAMDLETGSKGIIKGEYGLGIIMDMVAQTDALNEGDTIVTSGLGGNMPKGLFIGTTQEIKISNDKLFQQALIMPKVKYSNLDVVFVIK